MLVHAEPELLVRRFGVSSNSMVRKRAGMSTHPAEGFIGAPSGFVLEEYDCLGGG